MSLFAASYEALLRLQLASSAPHEAAVPHPSRQPPRGSTAAACHQSFLGTIYRQQAALYLLFMLLYVLATTLGVSWDAHVSRYYMYGDGSATSVARIVLEAAVVLMDAKYLLDEARQLQLHGVVQYMTGKAKGCMDYEPFNLLSVYLDEAAAQQSLQSWWYGPPLT